MKKNKMTYGICIGGIVLLVVAAFFLPQMLFVIQDYYRMTDTKAEVRSSLDISKWNASYEQNLSERISNFLNMQEITVTTIEHDLGNDAELQRLIEGIFAQEWFGVLYENMMLTTYVYTNNFKEAFPLSVQDCKKYLVHGTNYQDGVALMMWYLDLYLVPVETRIQILVDSETETIYYLKVMGNEKSAYEKYSVDKSQVEQLYYWSESLQNYFGFYYNYYEADVDALADQYGTYDGQWPWFIEVELDEECKVKFPLVYGEVNAEFVIWVKPGDGIYPDVTMGIPAIGEKIPEMMQN